MENISVLTSIVVVLGLLVLVAWPVLIFMKALKSLGGKLRSMFIGVGAWAVYMVVFVLVGATLLMTGILETMLSAGSMDNTYVTLEAAIQATYRTLIAFGMMYLCVRVFFVKKNRGNIGDAWLFACGYGLITLIEPIRRFAISCYVIVQNLMGNEVVVELPVNGDMAQRISNSVLAANNAALSLFTQVFAYVCWMALIVAVVVLIYVAVKYNEVWQLILAFLAKTLFRVIWNFAQMEVAPWYWGNDGLVIVTQGIITVVTCLMAYKTYTDCCLEKKTEE